MPGCSQFYKVKCWLVLPTGSLTLGGELTKKINPYALSGTFLFSSHPHAIFGSDDGAGGGAGVQLLAGGGAGPAAEAGEENPPAEQLLGPGELAEDIGNQLNLEGEHLASYIK